MTLIDRYILRTFFRVLVVCFLSLTGLFIVADFFSNFDEFLDLGKQPGGLPRVLAEYYGARSLVFFDRTSPLISLVAATFTVTGMQRSNELAALMAAGISKMRIAMPLIAGVVAVSLGSAASREWLIPHYRNNLMRNAQDWRGQARKEMQPKYDNRTDILFGGRYTVAAEEKIVSPTFRMPMRTAGFGNELSAESAFYRARVGDRPPGYLLERVTQPRGVDNIPSLVIDGQPVILTAADNDWLAADQVFVVSDVTFEQLAASSTWRQYSSTAELISSLHNPSLDFGADVRVAVHSRFVQPALDITLLFLGLPLVLSRETRNLFVAAGKSILVVGVFFLVILACQAAGNTYLISPSFAAWCPLLVFVPTARFLSAAFYS